MWVFDLERRAIVWANRAGQELWGADSLESLLAKDYTDMSETAVTRNLAVMAEHRRGRTTRAQWTLYPAGVPVTVEAHASGIELAAGRQAILYEAQALPQDLDAGALRGVEALQHTSVRIALHRLDGSVLLRNPAAVRAFGAVADAPADALEAMFVEPEDARELRRIALGGEEFSAEVRLHTRIGTRWHGLDARVVPDPVSGQRLIQLNARDIEQLKETEAALLAARDVAEQASLAKGRFLATMSHEIRTPLNGGALAVDRDLALSARIAADVPERVRGDAGRLRQVLTNLVGNAVKFTASGSVEVHVEADEVTPERIVLRIAVVDTGVGIPAAAREHLFEPFSQADGSVTRRIGGTGLGLALCRRLTETMGEALQVESTLGEGSRFWFGVHLGPAAPTRRQPTSPRVPTVHGSGRRLLLVDDNPVNLLVGTGILERMGFVVDTASNGQDALGAIHSDHVAVLMDIEMPVMDGLTATAELRRAGRAGGPTRPIIAMTAHGMSGDRDRFLAAGMDDYVPKPFRITELCAVLAAWLS